MARLAQLPRDTVFFTQITMEAAEDPDFLDAMNAANIKGALVGVEAVTPEGLKDVQVPLKKILEGKTTDVAMQGEDVLFVPASAINSESGSNTYSVFVVNGKSVAQKLVRLGERDNRGVGILSGLEPGAQVATSNLSQLFDGAPVSIQNRN